MGHFAACDSIDQPNGRGACNQKRNFALGIPPTAFTSRSKEKAGYSPDWTGVDWRPPPLNGPC